MLLVLCCRVFESHGQVRLGMVSVPLLNMASYFLFEKVYSVLSLICCNLCADASPVRGDRLVSDDGGPGPEAQQTHVHSEGES